MFAFAKKIVVKFAPDLRGYSKTSALRDLGAGITVGIVALPLSLALAIATGVPPILGLYTAGVAGFIAALTAGSQFSVSGPAAAMVPILSVIIQKHGLSELPYIIIMAALFLFLFALMGIGKYIRKVPESVVLGFTAGIAVVIFASQLNSFMGLQGLESHEHFVDKIWETITHLASLHWPTFLMGMLALAIIVFSPKVRYLAKIPPTLIAVLVTTIIAMAFPLFSSVATLGSAYGSLPMGFPAFSTDLDVQHFSDGDLWYAGFQIGALVAIESLLCAVVGDKLTKTRHRSNQELAAQGFGNLGAAFFGGLPATGVIARTGTIIKNNAATRVASMVHALVVIAFMVALAPLATNIPLTVLSAVLLVTAVKISEYKEVRHFVTAKSKKLAAVLLVTLILTVLTDLVKGVAAGLILHVALSAHGQLQSRRDRDGRLRLSEEEA